MGIPYVWMSPAMEVGVLHVRATSMWFFEGTLGLELMTGETKLEFPKYLDHRNFV